jgi:hypothetical protein
VNEVGIRRVRWALANRLPVREKLGATAKNRLPGARDADLAGWNVQKRTKGCPGVDRERKGNWCHLGWVLRCAGERFQ